MNYITKVIILAVVAISGVKAADVIVKQFIYPVMWSKAIDAVHENRIIRLLDNLERNLDEALGGCIIRSARHFVQRMRFMRS